MPKATVYGNVVPFNTLFFMTNNCEDRSADDHFCNTIIHSLVLIHHKLRKNLLSALKAQINLFNSFENHSNNLRLHNGVIILLSHYCQKNEINWNNLDWHSQNHDYRIECLFLLLGPITMLTGSKMTWMKDI